MVELVFKRGDYETVADALCLWLSVEDNDRCTQFLGLCVELLAELAQADKEFPPRLKKAIIRAIHLIDFIERVGVERFTLLLVRLKVTINDVLDERDHWISLLSRIIASKEGREQLPPQYWDLLVKLVRGSSGELPSLYDEAVLHSLVEKEEWEKLVCWLGVVWSMRPPCTDGLPVETIAKATALLLKHDPTAAKRLKELVMDSVQGSFGRMHRDTFKEVCDHGAGAESHL